MSPAKPRRWFSFRYSLRMLFVVVTVVCVVSGFWLNKAFRQRDAVRRFNQLTAGRPDFLADTPVTMLYRHEGRIHSKPIIAAWLHPLRDLIGDEAFGEPIGVQLQQTNTTDNDLRHFKDMATVEQIWLSGTRVTDKGLPYLHACSRLRFLALSNVDVTDEGLAQLTVLTDLESISLNGTKITDDGLDQLAKLTKLKNLWLRGTAITGAGYRKLQAALPECEIQADVPADQEKHRPRHWGDYRTY